MDRRSLQGKERRKHSRFDAVQMRIQFESIYQILKEGHGGEPGSVRTQKTSRYENVRPVDLSRGGASFITQANIPRDALLPLKITGAVRRQRFRTKAQVVWRVRLPQDRGYNIGVKFLSVDQPEMLTSLMTTFAKTTGV